MGRRACSGRSPTFRIRRRNYRHIAALVEFLGLPEDRFHSVVTFWVACVIKTKLPPNVPTEGYTAYFKMRTAVLFSDEQVEGVVEAIRQRRLPATWVIRVTSARCAITQALFLGLGVGRTEGASRQRAIESRMIEVVKVAASHCGIWPASGSRCKATLGGAFRTCSHGTIASRRP